VSVAFPSDELATIAANSLIVDPEPRKHDVTKAIDTDGSVLHAYVSQ
jgi:hypothetical protein